MDWRWWLLGYSENQFEKQQLSEDDTSHNRLCKSVQYFSKIRLSVVFTFLEALCVVLWRHIDASDCKVSKHYMMLPLLLILASVMTVGDHSQSHFCSFLLSQHWSAVTSCCFLFSYFCSSHCVSLIPCWSIASHCDLVCVRGRSEYCSLRAAILNHTDFLSCMNRYLISL